MYYNDNDRHSLPHVHVFHGEYEASYTLDGKLLDGKIPRQLVKYLKAWLTMRQDELHKAWGNVLNDTDPGKIQP
ncbi:MAG: DUF4160 domain-containing protein [Firmicutes bacterium]|nr:DUF4160 domain-containing protein [Bacillota bacterium]